MRKFSNFDKKLRTFKRKVQKAGTLEEFRNRMHYIKPTTRRRNAMNAARRREYRRRIEDDIPNRRNRLY